jgi:cell division cycle 2-like protein
MSSKNHRYKSSSHSHQSDDLGSSSKIPSRTVIYEEPSSTSNKTLKSSVRQVVQTSSFYNTSTTSKPAHSKPLTIGSGKQSRAINSDLYHSEIVDDEDEEEEEGGGEMDYSHDDQHQPANKRTSRRNSSEEQSKRRRHSSSRSSISDDNSDEHQRNEQRSPSEEGEEPESNSARSDDRHSKEEGEHQSITTTEDDEVEEEPVPHRSRFDDQDDDEKDEDDKNESESDRHHHHRHHHHRHHHHKRSRRHSSSTPASSSSKSTMTPPVSNSNHQIEKELIEEKPQLPNYYPAIQGCRRVDEYSCLNRIEEGTYGVVFRAQDKKTGEIVALKRLKMEKEKEGFPITSLREICCILKSQHENVCTVREIVVGDDMNRIFIVMDYVEHDLKSLMTHTMKKPFAIGEVKTLMYQLLSGVNHLHDNWIIHRDLKTSNLLLSNKGILKIADFGLAREYGSPLKPYTPIVVTLWYRAPELLLGIKEYSTPIDVWSVGAIFGELLLMKPLFPGKSELDQLNCIFKDLGTPREKIWPEYKSLPFTKKMTFSDYPYNRLRSRFDASLSKNGFDLLNQFLAYDPSRRISAINALKHDYFEESPRRIDPSMFPTWPSKNEEKDKTIRGGIQRLPGSNAATVQDEPKPPSAGKMYEKLLGAGDDDSYSMGGFQLRG